MDSKKAVAEIIARLEGIAGTPAETYLRSRGITMTPPDCIRYRRFASGKYGALVALATDEAGVVLAVQQIYLSDDGQKAPVKVSTLSDGTVDPMRASSEWGAQTDPPARWAQKLRQERRGRRLPSRCRKPRSGRCRIRCATRPPGRAARRHLATGSPLCAPEGEGRWANVPNPHMMS